MTPVFPPDQESEISAGQSIIIRSAFPVIAIGVPTIVDSSTLVYDALSKAGIENTPPELEKILENGRSFFVSLKESDEATKTLSQLIGDMIGIVFGTRFD